MGLKANKNYNPPINLNLNVRGLAQSATLAINELSNKQIDDGRRIFKLGLGQSPFPVPQPVVKALQENAHQKDYLPVKGLRQLRASVAHHHAEAENLEVSADDVLIGPGSKELMFLLQLVYYGDLVIPAPSWVSYAPQASIIGRKIRWVPTQADDDWRLTPATFEAFCRDDPDRPRIVILNYPNNPTGSTYRTEELKELARVARKFRVILLSDEIYGKVHHKGQHVSIARFYPEGTIISSGLSKWCGAGGWRLGTFTFPENLRWLLDAMAVVASETFTATSAPTQYAAITAFDGGEEVEEYLRQSRRVLGAAGRYLWQTLSDSGLNVPEPKGGFYLFPDFKPKESGMLRMGIQTSLQLCERLLKDTGVAALPGVSFGCPETDLTMRIAYVDFDGDNALARAAEIPIGGMGRAFVRAHCPNLVEAANRICNWLNS